mmetsp:Transcript_71576/g.213586  ORF Transcript_71576/g.213586 Transcript_71576/m.213586 type:complete len:322 (+) Transcript_71576:341-1306(+)
MGPQLGEARNLRWNCSCRAVRLPALPPPGLSAGTAAEEDAAAAAPTTCGSAPSMGSKPPAPCSPGASMIFMRTLCLASVFPRTQSPCTTLPLGNFSDARKSCSSFGFFSMSSHAGVVRNLRWNSCSNVGRSRPLLLLGLSAAAAAGEDALAGDSSAGRVPAPLGGNLSSVLFALPIKRSSAGRATLTANSCALLLELAAQTPRTLMGSHSGMLMVTVATKPPELSRPNSQSMSCCPGTGRNIRCNRSFRAETRLFWWMSSRASGLRASAAVELTAADDDDAPAAAAASAPPELSCGSSGPMRNGDPSASGVFSRMVMALWR